MSAARVVVTGVGLVTSLGASTASTMKRLLAGERGFREVSSFPIDAYAVRIAAEVPGLIEASSGLVLSDGAIWSRSDRLAVLAASEALSSARVGERDRESAELWVAASTGGMLETELALSRFFTGAPIEPDARLLRCHPISSPSERIQAACGPFARATTVCSACSSGTLALGLALGRLRRGEARWALAGGLDALSRLTFTGFGALASLDSVPCRPFDKDRKGLTLGEGAAFFVLEREDDARARGAKILGVLAGYAVGCEAHHITQPEPDGQTAERVMRLALQDAGVSPAQVGAVSAHGTGTPLNDPTEAAAIARVLGERAKGVPVSSQKGQLGHTLSAAGAVQAVTTLLAMAEGVVLPNGGLVTPEPNLPVRLVGPVAERVEHDVALCNSFGFGGTDASLVLARTSLGAPSELPRTSLVITAAVSVGALGELEGEASRAYVDAAREVDVAQGAEDPKAKLDAMSTRRLDRAARQVTRLTQLVLASGRLAGGEDVGLVAGSGYGSGDEACAFLARVDAKGPRFAPPLEFPNLVPSSPGAHAAIIAGLRGPSLSVSELGTTPLAVLSVVSDLLIDGRVSAIVAASAEQPNSVVERLLAEACGGKGEGPRGHGGAALLVERAEHAEARGARALARLVGVWSWSTLDGAPRPVIPRPSAPRREAIVAQDDARTRAQLMALGWEEASVLCVGPRAGWHDAVLALGLAAAVGRLSAALVDEVIVFGASVGRAGAALLMRALAMAWRAAIGVCLTLAGCSLGPATGPQEPAGDALSDALTLPEEPLFEVTSSEGWRAARSELDALRARLVPQEPRGYKVSAVFHEGWSQRSFSARGAYAVRPPDALRMQLVGPAGSLALDVWARGDEARLAMPVLDRTERFHASDEPPGRPTGFLRWWALRPLDGHLLAAYVNARGSVGRMVIRANDGALIDARLQGEQMLLSRRTEKDTETLLAERPPCGRTVYRSKTARLQVEVRCEGEAPTPSERAFADPDGEPSSDNDASTHSNEGATTP